jgi:hypothetical protein
LAEIQNQNLQHMSEATYCCVNCISTEEWWCRGLYTPVLYLKISWERIRSF